MAEQDNGEKRTFVRADLATRVKVQPVSREEFEHHKSMRLGGISGGAGADSLPNEQMGYLFDRLSRIEEKLDRILEKLDPDSCSEEMATYGTAQNISGAGVNLILEEALEAGQLVLISLSVPGFSIGFLQAYGEVVRVAPFEGQNQESFETSVKFLVISEEEREKLIAYAFQRQRQVIRDSASTK
jgi:c-di-GMP-binding flagellar brake protein YcgR